MKTTIISLLILLQSVNVFSQSSDKGQKINSETSENSRYDFNITVTQGYSYSSNKTNFRYINLDLGYKFIDNHELGICLGDNDLKWFGGYYRIYFADNFNVGLKIAKDFDHSDYYVLNEITAGKDLRITDNFYFRVQAFFSTRSEYPLGIKNENNSNKTGILFGINYLL